MNLRISPPPVALRRDAATAFALSTAFGLAAAAAVPAILRALPPESRRLPLPLPLFAAVLAVGLTAAYGLFALIGLRLARRHGLEPTPFLAATGRTPAVARAHLGAFAAGLLAGALLVAAVAAIQRFAPGTLPAMLHPPSLTAALIASVAASFGEEILFRLFLLSLLLRVLPRTAWAVALAVALSSLAFSAAHSPGAVFLFGGLRSVPPLAWVWLAALNGLLGALFAFAYLRAGILAAVLAHFGTDLIWHVAAQLAP